MFNRFYQLIFTDVSSSSVSGYLAFMFTDLAILKKVEAVHVTPQDLSAML